MTTAIEMNRMKAPKPNNTAPGANIAILPSPVEMEPTMRSGKPMPNKVMPTPMEVPALFLEDAGALDLNPILKRPIRLTTSVKPPMPMNMAPGMSIPRTSFFSSF